MHTCSIDLLIIETKNNQYEEKNLLCIDDSMYWEDVYC